MTGIWRYKEHKGDKYLVLRRDGTVPEWPSFVMAARDPAVHAGLLKYAETAEKLGYDPEYVADVRRMADEFEEFRKKHGNGDPDAPKHRKDDPLVLAMMDDGIAAIKPFLNLNFLDDED